MLSNVLFFLLYFRFTDVYFSNHLIFRAFHCGSLTLLSLKNTIYYGKSIIDSNNPLQTSYSTQPLTSSHYTEDFYLKIIPIYFILYIVYDLKNCNKRMDLLVHHLVCIVWASSNIHHNNGLISVCIFTEGVTIAYIIPTFKNQLIYRLLFTTIFRFPIWTFMIYEKFHNLSNHEYILNIFNFIVATFMIFIDCVWCVQNYKRLQKICNTPLENIS